MKRLITSFFSCFIILCVRSQNISVGAEAGLNTSFASAHDQERTFHGTPGVRYLLGGYADISMPSHKDFSIRPTLLFSRDAYVADIYSGRTPIRISYLTLTLPLIYHSKLMDGKLSFGLGPYFGNALGGKYISDGETTKIAFGSDQNKDDGKRLDIGLDANAAYQFNDEIMFVAKFDLGLRQMYNEPDTKVHTRNFAIAVSYLLWSGK